MKQLTLFMLIHGVHDLYLEMTIYINSGVFSRAESDFFSISFPFL